MIATLVALGLCVAAATLLCCFTSLSRHARAMAIGNQSSVARAPLCPSSRLLLKANLSAEHEVGDAHGAWGVGLTKSDAEDLLDWLEVNSLGSRKVSYVAGEGYTVR